MGCVSPDTHKSESERGTALMSILDSEEIRALKLIYEDIAERHIYQKIDYENFLLFFRKNGMWGSTLFEHFDLDHSELLAENEFIIGIAKIFKSTEEEKAKLLFSHFSKNKCEDSVEGVLYKDFVRMLYNYPKSDLKEVLHDQYFFETEIKGKLVNLNNPGTTLSRVPEKETVVMHYMNEKEQNAEEEVLDYDNRKSNEEEYDHFRKSDTDKDPRVNLNSSLTFFFYDKRLNVKMTSIHALVRKYAEMIFRDEGVNLKHGRIQEKSFISWANKHPKLFVNYYGGFHQEIWCISQLTGQLRYLELTPEKTSVGVMVQSKEKQKPKRVGLLYVKSFLIVHEPGRKENVLKMIYLEGLDVKKIFDEAYGFGISISHRNGIYKEKKFYFQHEELTLEWVETLKYYRSQTLYQQFSVGTRIGAGKFSYVYECVEISTGKTFALKEVETYKLSEEAKQIISNEAKILALLDHPNMPKFEKCFLTKTHNYLIMDLLKGIDLFEYVRERGKLSEFESIPIIKQIMKGILYLQTLGIVHRDLKPDNIMLMNAKEKLAKPIVKILDFGFANYVEEIKVLPQECKAVGTPNFIAPELIRGDLVTEKIDNFSIGSIVYYMLSGTLPFLGESVEEIFAKTKNVEFEFSNPSWKKVSAEAKNFIAGLMTETPETRMSLRTALKHKWITDSIIKEESSHIIMPAPIEKKKKSYEVY